MQSLNPIFEELKEKLPWHKNPEELALREVLWKLFDVDGKNGLSLAEVEYGFATIIKLPKLFPLKPVLTKAFDKSKVVVKSKLKNADLFVGRAEFRLLILYVRQFYELYVAFDIIDKDHDRTVDIGEFMKAVPVL